jgi:hypothetical protein
MDHSAQKKAFLSLRADVARLVNAADPIGLISGGAPTDEYSLEVSQILPRLKHAASEHALRQILHERFVNCFGAEVAGPEDQYSGLATDLWAIRGKWLNV